MSSSSSSSSSFQFDCESVCQVAYSSCLDGCANPNCLAPCENALTECEDNCGGHRGGNRGGTKNQMKKQQQQQHLQSEKGTRIPRRSSSSSTNTSTYLFTSFGPTANITGGGCAVGNQHEMQLVKVTGECFSHGQGHGSSMYYCDEKYSYAIIYSDVWCRNLISVTRATYECQTYNDDDGDELTIQYGCTNPSFGPTMPIVFPPSQSTVTSTCINNNPNGGLVCVDSEGAICTDVAIVGNVCYPPNFLTPLSNSTMSFCTPDGTYNGVAQYADNKCTELIQVTLTVTGECLAEFNANSAVTCNGAGMLTEPLPTIGETLSPSTYNGTTCASPQIINLFVPNMCFDNTIQQCPQGNSSQEIIFTQYNGWNGNCQGTSITQAQPVGICTNNNMLFCDGFQF